MGRAIAKPTIITESLNSREKLNLITYLARRVDHTLKPTRKWSDIRGALPINLELKNIGESIN